MQAGFPSSIRKIDSRRGKRSLNPIHTEGFSGPGILCKRAAGHCLIRCLSARSLRLGRILDPQLNPQILRSCTTSAYLGSPHGFVSRCKTYRAGTEKTGVSERSFHGVNTRMLQIEAILMGSDHVRARIRGEFLCANWNELE